MFHTAICFLLLGMIGVEGAKKKGGPNVLLIMTDDQDKLLNSLDPHVMPNVNEKIIKEGLYYDNHYCTVAWCCPSRVNFLTGKAAHNTNVTGLAPPYGGWPKFGEQGLNDNYLPIWLQAAGIDTYYTGKFLNAFGKDNYMYPAYPKGWNRSTFQIDPWMYRYMKSHWVNQHIEGVEDRSGEHVTLVTQEKALNMLETAASSKQQFFMMVAPVAPHVELGGGPPAPPPMFENSYKNATAPRLPNFNPDKPGGASWIKAKAKMTDKQIAAGDAMQVARLQNVAGVDVMVGLLMDKLKDHGILHNTYVIFTSDNGFHIGNHRLEPGKRCGFEEDINIPLLIRGPGVPKDTITKSTSSHTDMAPTVLRMMGVPLRDDFDGRPISYTPYTLATWNKNEHVQVEFWDGTEYLAGGAKPKDGAFLDHGGYYFNGTYKSLRLRTVDGYNFYYSVWCTGEKEFYDMDNDFYQMTNHLDVDAEPNTQRYFGRDQEALLHRLDAMLMVLKNCKQDSCRHVWKELFPKKQVGCLTDAMHPKYDAFFAEQPKVSFAHCIGGAIRELEGPQHVLAFK